MSRCSSREHCVCVCACVFVCVCVRACAHACARVFVSAVELVLLCMHYTVMFREICELRLIKTSFSIIRIVNSKVPGCYIVLL